jgi:deoxyribose-phosphate aldolase
MGKYRFCDKIVNRLYDADVPYTSVSKICYESLIYGFDGVQVFPNTIELCKKILRGSGVKVYALIAYPHGTFLAEQKAVEIEDAVSLGADGVEVCLNCLDARSENWDLIRKEMRQCRDAAKRGILKYILEIEWITDSQIKECCKIALEEKIDCIVTSTGLYNTVDENKNDIPILAGEKDIRLIKDAVGEKIKIMAQGYINNRKMADDLIRAGADYIGVEETMDFVLGD